jgi:hypothetical protein
MKERMTLKTQRELIQNKETKYKMKPQRGLPTYPTYEIKEKITNRISLIGLSILLFVMNLLPISLVRKDL